MKPIRYNDKIIEAFRSNGYWTGETFTDFWLKNAGERLDKEALVHSTMRITRA